MPQEECGFTRTWKQQDEFKWMMRHINVLYLKLQVLVLLDLSSMGRFWPVSLLRPRTVHLPRATTRHHVFVFAAICRSWWLLLELELTVGSSLAVDSNLRRGARCRR